MRTLSLLLVCCVTLSAQETDAFAWFDRLGFPDVRGTPFVRIWVGGRGVYYPEDPVTGRVLHGFLLSDEGRAFTALTDHLSVERFEKRAPGADPPQDRIGYQVLETPADTAREEVHWRLGLRSRLFFFSWACARRGEARRSRELWAAAVAAGKGPLVPAVREELGKWLFEQRLWDFLDTKTSWEELRSRFALFAENFSGTSVEKRAGALAKQLGRMVEAARKRPGKPWKEMTGEERIDELVFLLQEEWGDTRFPWMYLFFLDPDSTPGRLAAMGYGAVPRLIEAFDDERLTRCPQESYGGRLGRVLRVREMAPVILKEITGRFFDTKAEAEAWWAVARKKGERRVLAEGALAGGVYAADDARRLAERYPDAAFEVIRKALEKAADDDARTGFLFAMGAVTGKEAAAILHDTLRDAGSLRLKEAAASALRERKDPRLTEVLTQAWHAGAFDAAPEHFLPLLPFSVVADRLRRRPPAVRWAVLRQIHSLKRRDAASERLLLSELEDTDVAKGVRDTLDGVEFRDPVLRDVAKWILARLWPDKYR